MVLLSSQLRASQAAPPNKMPEQSVEERAAALLKKMSLEDKRMLMCHEGARSPCAAGPR